MASSSSISRHSLQRESELRVEVGWESSIRLQVVEGNAEIFGTELPPQFKLTFTPGLKFAVSSRSHSFLSSLTPPYLLRKCCSNLKIQWILKSQPNVHWKSDKKYDSEIPKDALCLEMLNKGRVEISSKMLVWNPKPIISWNPVFRPKSNGCSETLNQTDDWKPYTIWCFETGYNILLDTRNKRHFGTLQKSCL